MIEVLASLFLKIVAYAWLFAEGVRRLRPFPTDAREVAFMTLLKLAEGSVTLCAFPLLMSAALYVLPRTLSPAALDRCALGLWAATAWLEWAPIERYVVDVPLTPKGLLIGTGRRGVSWRSTAVAVALLTDYAVYGLLPLPARLR